jgi:hypothetical protein
LRKRIFNGNTSIKYNRNVLLDYNAKAHKSKEITEFWFENRHTAKTIWSKTMLYDKNISETDEKIEKH